jgi:hypothetical protein
MIAAILLKLEHLQLVEADLDSFSEILIKSTRGPRAWRSADKSLNWSWGIIGNLTQMNFDLCDHEK